MNNYYEQIMSLDYAADFKELVSKWKRLSENTSGTSLKAPMLIPDMILCTPTGSGRTTLLRLLSEFLTECGNLLNFYGDVKFFEFYLNYTSPTETFTEFHRLITEIGNAAGFRSEYRGIVCIDINEWLDHIEEKHFIDLMEYLSNNSNDWLIVLSYTKDNNRDCDSVESLIRMFLRVETICIEMPETDVLIRYTESRLSEYGLSVTDSGRTLLAESIDKLRTHRYFDGYKTVKLFCKDIIYTFYTGEDISLSVLDADALAPFSKDGKYITSMMMNYDKAHKIGFAWRE